MIKASKRRRAFKRTDAVILENFFKVSRDQTAIRSMWQVVSNSHTPFFPG